MVLNFPAALVALERHPCSAHAKLRHPRHPLCLFQLAVDSVLWILRCRASSIRTARHSLSLHRAPLWPGPMPWVGFDPFSSRRYESQNGLADVFPCHGGCVAAFILSIFLPATFLRA